MTNLGLVWKWSESIGIHNNTNYAISNLDFVTLWKTDKTLEFIHMLLSTINQIYVRAVRMWPWTRLKIKLMHYRLGTTVVVVQYGVAISTTLLFRTFIFQVSTDIKL